MSDAGYTVQREAVIDASPDRIYAQIVDFQEAGFEREGAAEVPSQLSRHAVGLYIAKTSVASRGLDVS